MNADSSGTKYYKYTGDFTHLLNYDIYDSVKKDIINGKGIYIFPEGKVFVSNGVVKKHEFGYDMIQLFTPWLGSYTSFIACGFEEVTYEEYLKETIF